MGAPRVEFPYGSGGGGGGVSGGGTPGTIPIWGGPASLSDSPLSFSGSTLTASAALTTFDFSAANQTWRVPNTAFALEIGAAGLNPTLKVQASLRYLGIDSPSSPADKLHMAENGPLALRMQNVTAATYWQHKVDSSGDWGLAVNGGANAVTVLATTGNIVLGTGTPPTANSRLTVAGGFIVPAAGFGVYQAGDHLTLSGGAGKNVHLKPNDGGVLAVNVGSATCDMTAVAGYVLAVGGPVRATGTSVTVPAFTRHDAATTGMYFPGLNEIGLTTGGGAAMYIGAASATPPRPVSVGQASGMAAQFGVYRSTTGTVQRYQNGVTTGFADCLVAFNAASTATTTQDAYIDLITNGGVAAEFMLGSSASIPVTFRAAGTQQAAITTTGNFQFNSGYGSSATAYGTRAWVYFNGTGTPTIQASGNVSSITDNGVGDYSINFTSAMPNANYAISTTVGHPTGTPTAPMVAPVNTARGVPTTALFHMYTLSASFANTDANYIYASVIR